MLRAKNRHWLLVVFPFFPESREAASYHLFEAGALGCEERDNRLHAYFEDQEPAALLQRLQDAVTAIREAGLALPEADLAIERIAEQDWMYGWRRFFKPVTIGGRLLVRPPWEPRPAAFGGAEVVIEPKQAFGTGTHASTHLVLQAIVGRTQAGNLPALALDIGTGSGILAIAHALLRPRSTVVGFDIDPVAVVHARENIAINKVAGQIALFTGTIDALAPSATYPLIYANLERHLILPQLECFFERLQPGGVLVLSGLLRQEEPEMRMALAEFPATLIKVACREEWMLMIVKLSK